CTVLYGNPDGSGTFISVLDFPIGRRLQNIAAGQLNENDNFNDIAVSTNFRDQFFIASGTGSGTFNQPRPFSAGGHTTEIAIGNFDNKNGNDLVTVTRSSGEASVMLNQGRNQGFAPAINFPVGNQPMRVVTADVNGDGLDDVIALNTGTSGADDISVL